MTLRSSCSKEILINDQNGKKNTWLNHPSPGLYKLIDAVGILGEAYELRFSEVRGRQVTTGGGAKAVHIVRAVAMAPFQACL